MANPWTWMAEDPDLEAHRDAVARAVKTARETAISAHLERLAIERVAAIGGIDAAELTKGKNQARVNVTLAVSRWTVAVAYAALLPAPPPEPEDTAHGS